MFLQSDARISPCDNEAEKINNQLIQILTWLEANPNINACKDVEKLLFFLRNCKFDLERTKRKIKNFHQMRAERVEWFSNRDPFLPEIQELLTLGVFLPVDGTVELDGEQYKVVIIRTAAHDPRIHTQNNVFKVSIMILDLLLKLEPENCIRGIVAIFDMDGVHIGHARQMNPKLIKRYVLSWQAYPCQPKLLEFVNAPTHVNIVLNTFRLFMTSKMRSRLFIRKDISFVKCANLPVNIGGPGMNYTDLALKWKNLVEENTEFYIDDDRYKSVLKS